MKQDEAKELFLEAIELEPAARRVFIDSLRDRDPTLHDRVARLVSAHDRAEADTPEGLDDDPRRVVDGFELPHRIGRYELEEKLGFGGTGIVYRARQLDLERTVAVKLLRTGQFATDRELRRFRSEAELVASLDHPSIVPVYEVGSHEGHHFIAMKLVDGESLDRRTADYREPRAAAALIAQVARAVHHGHRHGVLHRDIKPSNVLLDVEGRPFVADFGTAKRLDGTDAETLTGVLVGTPAYMAPEQATSGGRVTVSTDVYGLGCTLYELLAGRPPFDGGDLVEVLRRVREERPASPKRLRPDLSRDLSTIAETCLAKEPSRRYPSAFDVAEDLDRWLAFQPIRARAAGRLERLFLAWRRNPVVWTLAGAVAVLATVLVVSSMRTSNELRSALFNSRAAIGRLQNFVREVHLAEIRQLNRGDRAGRRARSILLLRQVASFPNSGDLRTYGFESLSRPDLESVASWPRHRAEESSIGFDRDLTQYCVGRRDGALVLHDASNGSIVGTLAGAGESAVVPVYSADGRFLLAHHGGEPAGGGTRVDVWDLDRREVLYSGGDLSDVEPVFAPHEPVLCFATKDGRVRERDLVTGVERSLLDDRAWVPARMSYSPEGDRWAAFASPSGTIRVFTREGELIREFGTSEQSFASICWSPDSSRIAATESERRVLVWDVASGELLRSFDLGGDPGLALFPRNGLIAAHASDRLTRLWDLRSGELLVTVNEELVGASSDGDRLAFVGPSAVSVRRILHEDYLLTLSGHGREGVRTLDFSPDGRFLATGCVRRFVLWNLDTGASIDQRAREDVGLLRFDREGRLHVGHRGGLERWSVREGRLAGEPEVLSNDHHHVAARGQDGAVFGARDDDAVRLLVPADPGRSTALPIPAGTTSIALCPDGDRLACGGFRDGGVLVMNTRDGTTEVHLAPGEPVDLIRFSPDGRWMVLGNLERYRIFEAASWTEAREIVRRGRHYGPPTVAAFSPTSDLIAVTLDPSRIGVMSVPSGRYQFELEAPRSPMLVSGQFSTDGDDFVAGSRTGAAFVWKIADMTRTLEEAGLTDAR